MTRDRVSVRAALAYSTAALAPSNKSNQAFEIEFIGGPYDGHKQRLESGCPAEVVAWMVCRDAFRLLSGDESRSGRPITGVAIYELRLVQGLFQYRFLLEDSLNEFTNTVSTTRCQTHVLRRDSISV